MSVAARTPRVYLEQALPSPEILLETGVPAFVGLVDAEGPGKAAGDELFARAPVPGVATLDVASWARLEARAGRSWAGGYLGFAIRGFFENGGARCHVVAPRKDGIAKALSALDPIGDFDLVCAPDLAALALPEMVAGQAALVDYCASRGGCFAILDSIGSPVPSGAVDLGKVKAHKDMLVARLAAEEKGLNAALYAPWVKVREACPVCGGLGTACTVCWGTGAGFVPPCGQVAGVYARTDRSAGVHKAPANEALEGVLDLQLRVGDAQQADPAVLGLRVNCLRAFPGRGLRIWGARTLSPDDAWIHVGVRRLVLTMGRWLELSMPRMAFEQNDLRLWARIGREVGAFLGGLFQQGAFRGAKPDEAFFVRCNAETNPPEVRDAGQVVAEVGIAPTRPSEFIVVRLIGSADGVSVSALPAGGP